VELHGVLAKVGKADRELGRLPGFADRREQDADEQRDDRDDHEQLDQGKCTTPHRILAHRTPSILTDLG
jgi:hypothetical protein